MDINFTKHAEHRVKQRGITKEDVVEAILNPTFTFIKHGKLYYQRKTSTGTIEVICEKEGNNLKIITLYWI